MAHTAPLLAPCHPHPGVVFSLSPNVGVASGYQTLIFHLFSRQIYGAIDKENLRNRRQLSKELIRTRLLILDFVLCDPNRKYLETEADKVEYFNRELGIPLTLIPCRTYKSRVKMVSHDAAVAMKTLEANCAATVQQKRLIVAPGVGRTMVDGEQQASLSEQYAGKLAEHAVSR